MAEETSDRSAAPLTWDESQRRAGLIWTAMQESFSEPEILAFCIHYIGAQAVGDFAETPEFVDPAKALNAWYHFILKEIERGLEEGILNESQIPSKIISLADHRKGEPDGL